MASDIASRNKSHRTCSGKVDWSWERLRRADGSLIDLFAEVSIFCALFYTSAGSTLLTLGSLHFEVGRQALVTWQPRMRGALNTGETHSGARSNRRRP
jgi:hypothetical protein